MIKSLEKTPSSTRLFGILEKIKKTTKNTAIQALHIIWAEHNISLKDRNAYMDELLSKRIESFDPDAKILIEKATNIRTDIIFWEHRVEDSQEVKLFKKYLSNYCIKEYSKGKWWKWMLNLYADHYIPGPVEDAAKKSGLAWELKRIKDAWWMSNYWWKGLKKWCRISFKENEIVYFPWYQVPHIVYKAEAWLIKDWKANQSE